MSQQQRVNMKKELKPVTAYIALQALDSMDDFTRMAGFVAHGPVATLKAFIEQAAVASQPKAEQAEGWVSVPVKAIERMLFAAEMLNPRGYSDLYAAMLAAAPKAPQ